MLDPWYLVRFALCVTLAVGLLCVAALLVVGTVRQIRHPVSRREKPHRILP